MNTSSPTSCCPHPTSSPPRTSPPTPTRRSIRAKEKANPSITPRKFRRFFTPRSHGSQQTSTARQALFDITAPSNNRNVVHSSPLRAKDTSTGNENSPPFTRDFKRRKMAHTPESSPEHVYSRKRQTPMAKDQQLDEDDDKSRALQSSPSVRVSSNMRFLIDEDEDKEVEEEGVFLPRRPLQQIAPLTDRGLSGRLLQLSFGNSTRGARQRYEYPVNDWQDETSSFYSRASEVHSCTSIEGSSLCIPFCATSCNTNTLTAIGDEEGRVRLLESGRDSHPSFSESYLAFRVHTNAIIDMTFSEDDTLLATASGDSTARVVDMNTQATIAILGSHYASLKQVRFQPGANNHSIIATSSRDGSVQIWDLRCKGLDGPVNHIQAPVEPHRTTTRSETRKLLYGRPINSIYDAHKPTSIQSQTATIVPMDAPSRGEASRRVGDVSVTSLSFLSPGREHLILTSSEADAAVKLWDIRSVHNKRKSQVPLSSTCKPQSHNQWRHFGITSMSLSTDSSRLYALCKDNTVYAYSTAHLILGQAPELSLETERRGPARPTQEGLGPLYGFRHPKFHATSFYVKSAIRKANHGHSELLAVGSSDGSAILFPTDERYFPKPRPTHPQSDKLCRTPIPQQRPALRRSGSGFGTRQDDSIPISTNGTALIRGHDREVGSLTWTSDGELVTVGDDYFVRVWREGEDARDLRTGGEAEGRRWGCGWADVREGYDDDEC